MTSPPAPRSRRSSRLEARWLPLAALALAYAAAVVLGRATRLEGGQLALVWPAAAGGFLWLLFAWERGRLGVHLGALVVVTVGVNAATGAPVLLALGFGAANAVQATVTAGLLRREPAPWRLRSVRSLTALALACAGGAVASAVVGGLVLWQLGAAEPLWTVLLWSMRNCSSALVLGALALRLADRSASGAAQRRTAGRSEATAASALLVAAYAVVFGPASALPLEFLLLPLSMWVALRARTTTAAVHVALAGAAVVALTAAGRGPFAEQDVAVRVLLAQAFVTVAALVVLVLALSADERAGLVARLRAEQSRSAAQAEMLETVLDTVDVAIVACDDTGRLTLANRTARELHLDCEAGGQAPSVALRRTDGTDLRPDELPLAQVLRKGRVSEPLITVTPPDSLARTVHCVGRALRDDRGGLRGAVVVHTDVTALRASEQQFRAAFEDGPTPMARLAEDGTVEQVNAAMRRFLALPSRRLVGVELVELAIEEDRGRLRTAVAERTGRTPVEVRLRRADGGAVWCEVTTTVVRSPDGQAYVLVQVLDVHARKIHELALEDVAHRDALTGVDNRHVLDRRLGELLHARDRSVVLACLDLDGFKAVNDSHGHEAGDAVLRAVGARLLGLVRADDIAVRLGGDEFVLACPVPSGAAAAQFAAALTERVEAALSEPVEHAGLSLTCGISVGTALAVPGSDPAGVLHQADLAMYAAKRARKRASAGAPGFFPAPTPPDEHLRLRALRAHRVLDTPPARVLDDLVEAAALVAGVPIALVTLVDEDRQWFLARCGLQTEQTGRDVSFCAHVVAADDEVHVQDARRDPRFADNPLVTGDLGIRSYAGFPLRTADGFVLGSLCVIGHLPALLDDLQRGVLRLLAEQVMSVVAGQAPAVTAAQAPAVTAAQAPEVGAGLLPVQRTSGVLVGG